MTAVGPSRRFHSFAIVSAIALLTAVFSENQFYNEGLFLTLKTIAIDSLPMMEQNENPIAL